MEKKLYTHDLASEILDMFECILADQDVILKSPEDDDRDEDSGYLYGSTYSDLFDETEDELVDVCEKFSIPHVRDVYESSVKKTSNEELKTPAKKFGKNGEKLYTHDLAAKIVEMFEEVLDSQGVILASPEDGEKEPDNKACLYGSTYSDLLDEVENRLISICEEYSVQYIGGEFSGNF